MKPFPAVGILIIKNKKVLLGKRLSKHAFGTWCPPGGKLDFNESLENCAIRETKEETGMNIKIIKQGPTTNNIFKEENFHSISIFFIATSNDEPIVKEKDKCEQWKYFEWDNLPNNLCLPLKLLKEQNFNPF